MIFLDVEVVLEHVLGPVEKDPDPIPKSDRRKKVRILGDKHPADRAFVLWRRLGGGYIAPPGQRDRKKTEHQDEHLKILHRFHLKIRPQRGRGFD